jgi:hypothetical protein
MVLYFMSHIFLSEKNLLYFSVIAGNTSQLRDGTNLLLFFFATNNAFNLSLYVEIKSRAFIVCDKSLG